MPVYLIQHIDIVEYWDCSSKTSKNLFPEILKHSEALWLGK